MQLLFDRVTLLQHYLNSIVAIMGSQYKIFQGQHFLIIEGSNKFQVFTKFKIIIMVESKVITRKYFLEIPCCTGFNIFKCLSLLSPTRWPSVRCWQCWQSLIASSSGLIVSHLFLPRFDCFLLCQHRIRNIQSSSIVFLLEGDLGNHYGDGSKLLLWQ